MSEHNPPERRKLESVVEYEDALDRLFARTGRRLRIFDHQLGKRYNGVRRSELLRRFLLASRTHRIEIVLHDASSLQRDCPRLILLLRQFSYAISIDETEPQAKKVHDPFAVMDERDYVHRFHYNSARGLLALDDPEDAHAFVQRFAEIREASAPAVSATTLGL